MRLTGEYGIRPYGDSEVCDCALRGIVSIAPTNGSISVDEFTDWLGNS